MARRTLTRTTSRPTRSRFPEDDLEDDYDDLDDDLDDEDDDLDDDLDDDPDDEEEPEPPRARRRTRNEEEPPSRTRRTRRHEDEDEPRTRRSTRRRSEESEPSRPSRRRRHDTDEEERTSRRSGRSSRAGRRDTDEPRRNKTRSSVGRGWNGSEAVQRAASGDFADPWKFPPKPTLCKFLEPAPFLNYAEHWIDEAPKKKSFVCIGEDCPLCDDLGDRPNAYYLFNMLDLSDPDNPKNAFLKASKSLARQIETFAQDKRSKPIDRYDVYFSMHRVPEKGARPQIALVKARDVEEDFDMLPFEEDELDEFRENLITEDAAISVSSRTQLREIVALVDDLA